MAFVITLRENNGPVLRQLIDEDDVLAGLLSGLDEGDYPYLSRIDRYDDTAFTPLQMRGVLPELKRLRLLGSAASGFLESIEKLAVECMGDVHVKLEFVGD
jgi:hypothetical protein